MATTINVADKTTLDAVYALLQSSSGAIKSVQRGSQAVDKITSSGSSAITHSSVNVSKSFIILNGASWYNGSLVPLRVASRSATSFQISTCGSFNEVSGSCSWQLVEFY
jgi:hypothetical protein